jgi:hypothetical protein
MAATSITPAATPSPVAFMITKVMKAELEKLGYRTAQIDELTPAEAHQILSKRRAAKSFEEFADPVEITLFVKSGGPLTKCIELAADGSVASDSSECRMSRGSARRVGIADVTQLGKLIEGLAANEAIALGALRPGLPDLVQIITKRELNGAALHGVIARNSQSIVFSNGQTAFALLDFDTKGMPPDVAARLDLLGGFWPALVSVLPELGTVAHVSRASTSAGLFRGDTGERIPGSNGLHIYLLVQDGADIERFLKTLHARCWLTGFGWMMIGAAGQVLERSIVDRTVGAPERLVFEGAPVLEPPLQQKRESRRPTVSGGKAFDTIASCPPLTILETARLRELQARETNRLASESARARAAFVAQQTERLVERTGMATEIAADVIARWCNGVLLPDVELLFDDQDFRGMTAGDVLADPLRFEGATLADPLEGIGYGRCKAKVMLRSDGAPWIHSFAHGRTVYELRLDARTIRLGVEKARDEAAVDTFVRLALAADLDDVELEKLVDYTARRTGVGVRAMVRKFKAAQEQKAEHRAQELKASSLAERRDPRPQIDRPPPDAEWLPQMKVLNDVLGASSAPLPPMRDIEGAITKVHKRPVPGMHAFSNQDANLE